MNSYSYEEIHVGMTESFERTVGLREKELFQEITGDENLLHTSAEFAESRGFKGEIQYGMLSSALYSTLVGNYLPGNGCILIGIDIDMYNPLYGESTLTVSGEVKEKNDVLRIATIKAVIRDEDNTRISAAKIRVGFLEKNA